MPLPRRLGLILALAAPAAASAQSLVIGHEPADCVLAGSRPRVDACIEPVEAVQEAQVQFRGEGEADWRSVEMEREGACFVALLPKPGHQVAVQYRIEALDRTMNAMRSPEFRVAVVRDRRGCLRALDERSAAAAAGTGQGAGGGASAGAPRKGRSGALTAAVVGGGVALAGGVAAAVMKEKSPAPTTTTLARPVPTTTTLPSPTTTTTLPTTTTTTLPPPTTTTLPPPTTTTLPPPTTTTTTLPPPTTTTLPPPTTTTTTTPPSCQYGASPDRTFPILGGSGVCNINASPASCSWNAEVSPPSATWLALSGARSGTGNGSVSYTVAVNTGGARAARIRVREEPNAGCTINQDAVLGGNQNRDGVEWTSQLDVAGGRGQVVVDGTHLVFQERGLSQGGGWSRGTVHRVEAMLVAAAGQPGSWRFELRGEFVPGSLRPVGGQVIQLAGDAVVFRLAGKPGERVVFVFRETLKGRLGVDPR